MVSPYDHLRPTDAADVPSGTYRVVGVDEEAVTLLRVTDPAGARQNTGHVERVERETLDRVFEPAPNPDAGFDPLGKLRGVGQGLYWSVRGLF